MYYFTIGGILESLNFIYW